MGHPTATTKPHIQRHDSQLKILEHIERAKELLDSLPPDAHIETVCIGNGSFDIWPEKMTFRKMFAGQTVARKDLILTAVLDGVKFSTIDRFRPAPQVNEVTLPEWSEA